jgi:hypothetical protein
MRDADLTHGQLATVMGTDPRRFGGAGLYVTVYRIGDWQVRCFCSNIATHSDPPRDIAERYQRIARFVEQRRAKMPALLRTHYLAEGIYVSGSWRPVIKSAWVTEAMRLGGFILEHRGNAQMMAALAEAWRLLVYELEHAPMAHGDLDLTNVLVQLTGRQPILRLIDYDNIWIPALDGRPQTECGHEAFQHPHFFRPLPTPDTANRPYNKLMDRFSALVIYLSLLALSIEPRLYLELQASEDERLLFSRADYERPTLESSNIMLVRKRCGTRVEPFVNELLASLAENRMPQSLEALIAGVGAGKTRTGAPAPRVGAPPPASSSSSSPLSPPPSPPPAAIPTGHRVPLGGAAAVSGQQPALSAGAAAPLWPVAQPGHAAFPTPADASQRQSQPQSQPRWPVQPVDDSAGTAVWIALALVALLFLLLASGAIHV